MIDIHHGDCLGVLRFGSVCSGIEAATVAWHPLGWQAAWLSEIEPFPSAVLAHHYPDVPNLGDMTTIAERIRAGLVEAPDMLCGGTPCQAFSVAGQRRSLSDERGNISLTFCEIADAIDDVRAARGDEPCIVFWENVPGVLSTKDNAFGCFIAALAGGTEPVVPPDRWTDAGLVLGPKRAVAWRVLDAQYFGVAQRRRRVFVVASARKGFDPAAVLFEFDGVRRDSPPSREAGKDTAGSTGDGVARCVTAGEMKRQDWETCTMVAQPVAFHHNAQACQLPGPGRDTSVSDALTCSQQAAVSYAIQAGALRTNPNSGPDGVGVQADHAYTLEARAEVQAVCVTGDVFHTLRAEGFDASEDGTGRGTPLVPVAFQPGNLKRGCGSKPNTEVFPTLAASHGRGQSDQDPHIALAVALRGREGGATAELGDDLQNCLRASSGGGDKPHVMHAMQVRRLTPRECERLQGFPDDYTAIPWRGKPADQCPDGPRYKALGNSWAVPVVRWIGARIAAAVTAKASEPPAQGGLFGEAA